VGLLALDVSRFGVVMSADSQPVDLLDGRCRIFRPHGSLRNNPIVIRRGGGLTGLIGYVGREGIGGTGTRGWLERFSAQHPNEPLLEFCHALADALTREWRRRRLKSGLIIFVSGIERREVRFWFIHNTQGLYDKDWTYIKPLATFQAIIDLDANYIPRDLAPGQTKEQLLTMRMYFFRNGVLRPSALVFDAFNSIMQAIYAQQIPGLPRSAR
jgi:hypothetical protein